MRVRPHVCAAALACLPLLAAASGGAPRSPSMLAGTVVHSDAAMPPAPRPGAVAAREPVCSASNPHGDYALVAVIARPAGAPARMTATVYRSLIAAADGVVYQQAEESGAPGADLVFACDATGAVRVDDVALPTALSDTTFDSVVADLGALGYERPNEKYVVWLDGTPPNAPCGSADIVSDQAPTAANRTAIGPDWAVSFGCNSILHETMHVLGAVGFGAPHSTGGGHCWDGKPASDVMCYDDGGPSVPAGGVRNPCADGSLHLDCGHDDYFAAGPVPASTYLASHWNVAGCYDRFLVDYGCPGVVAPEEQPPRLAVAGKRKLRGGKVRVTFRLSRPQAGAVSVAYAAPAARGRLVIPGGSVAATLEVRAGASLTISDPEGLWIVSTRVSLR